MTAESGNPFAEGDVYRPLQFTLRSLLIFTFVACVVMSIGRALGAVLMLLILVHIILAKFVEADCRINRDEVRSPLLALAGVLSLVIFPIVFMPTLLLVVTILASFFRMPA